MQENDCYEVIDLPKELVDIVNNYWSRFSTVSYTFSKSILIEDIFNKDVDNNIFLIASIYIFGSIIGDKNINIESSGFIKIIQEIYEYYKNLNPDDTENKGVLYPEIFKEFFKNYMDILNNKKDIDVEFIKSLRLMNKIAFEYSWSTYWFFLILLVGLSSTNVLGEIEIIKMKDERFEALNRKFCFNPNKMFLRISLSLDQMNFRRYIYNYINNFIHTEENPLEDTKLLHLWGIELPQLITVCFLMIIIKSDDCSKLTNTREFNFRKLIIDTLM